MEPIWRIKLRSTDKNELVDYIYNEKLDTSCGGPKKLKDETFEIEAFVKDSQMKSMTSRKNAAVDMIVYDNIIDSAAKKQNDVSKENRFSKTNSKERTDKPEVRGFGIKE